MALWPTPELNLPDPETQENKALRDSLRKDSLRQVREARWAHYKDSCKRADDARFAAWSAERKARYDSFFLADSLWRDSVGFYFPRRLKKDTIIDLNHCDTTDLQFIRGIGHYTACQIVRYREQLGGFRALTQLTDAPLAKLHLDTLAHYFIIDTTAITRIAVNNASIKALQRHPYIRPSQAKAIYEHRRRQLRLRSIDDLRSLPDLPDSTLLLLAPYLSFE